MKFRSHTPTRGVAGDEWNDDEQIDMYELHDAIKSSGLNHLEQVNLQLTRDPRPLPTMTLNPAVKDIFSFQYEDFTLEGYDPHPHIAGVVAV